MAAGGGSKLPGVFRFSNNAGKRRMRIKRRFCSVLGERGFGLLGLLLLLEAGAAQHRSALGGLERNRSFCSTFGTGGTGLRADALIAAGSFGLALFAVLGVVFKLFIVEKDLLACREDEFGAAVRALEYSIGEFHVAGFPGTGTLTESAWGRG